MNGELRGMQKEAVMTFFFLFFPGNLLEEMRQPTSR
jgi:hypothetical protein